MKIRTKILTGSLVSVLLTVLFTSLVNFRLTRNILIDASLEESKIHIQSSADEFNAFLGSLRADLTFLSNTPPIQGMIRALDNQGIDPNDDSTYQEWVNRLSDIFVPLAESKPAYMQIRYLDENGNELVRVDSQDGQVNVIDSKDLQNKKDRYYFKETMSLSPGEIYVSDIDLNKEGTPSKVVVPFQPTIRYATPVSDSQGNKRGMVITNINITNLLATLNQTADQTNQKHSLLDPAGFYLVHPQSDKQWSSPQNLDTGFNLYQDYPDIAAKILSRSTETLIAKGNIVTHTPVQIDPDNLDRFIIILRETPPFIPISVRSLSLTIAAISLGLIALSSLLANYIARSISSGVSTLQKDVEIITSGDLDHKVITKSQDEIGSLAKAFNTMTAAIKDSRAEIDTKVKEQTQEIIKTSDQLQDQRLAILNVLEDVEEDKQVATRERDKIQTILQSVGDGVLVVDVNRKVLIFNQAAEQISGFTIEELLDKPYNSLLKFINEENNKPTSAFIDEAISTGQVKEMANHVALVHKDGHSVPVADSAAPFKNKDGSVQGCIVVFRDVTKDREVDKMKTEFISLASHQLRTPLSAMKWFLEMLLGGDVGKLTKEQQEQVENINQSNERMISLVNALLNVSRIESGRLSIEPTPTDICGLAKQTMTELEPQTQGKSVSVSCKTPKKLKVNVDPKLISEVLQNLIGNAIKYTPDKGKIDVVVGKNSTDIVIKVTDTGLGIPKQQQTRIFEKFFRADNVLKLETDGTGLGLYLAKKIIKSSGGKIGFESTVDKGSTFWFSLPLSGSPAHKGEVKISANLAGNKPS